MFEVEGTLLIKSLTTCQVQVRNQVKELIIVPNAVSQ